MNNRMSLAKRETSETKVYIKLNLDGKGVYSISTGLGFFDHMLELFSKHSMIDLEIKVKGDLYVDEHHTIEDTGIVLGQAIRKALGTKTGIERYGFFVPMDESLCSVALDLGGRSYLVWNAEFKKEKVGDLPTDMIEHFFKSFSDNLLANIHINLLYGNNDHHKVESIFKGVAKALRFAISRDKRVLDLIPSTKGHI